MSSCYCIRIKEKNRITFGEEKLQKPFNRDENLATNHDPLIYASLLTLASAIDSGVSRKTYSSNREQHTPANGFRTSFFYFLFVIDNRQTEQLNWLLSSFTKGNKSLLSCSCSSPLTRQPFSVTPTTRLACG